MRPPLARTLVLLSALGLVVTAPPLASAHEDDPDQTPEITAKTDNVALVEHHWFPEGSDLYFQRRDGRQVLDGRVVNAVKDYAFVGGDGNSSDDDGGLHVFDVTDPDVPVHLADIPCHGYHAEVAVYENLLLQGIDDDEVHCEGEAADRYDPNGVNPDTSKDEGVRVWDVTDPANPVIIDFIGRDELGGGGVHNLTVIPWAGLLYLATSDFLTASPRFGYIDLTDPEFPVTLMDMKEISPNATAACHDIGLDPNRELAFCAAVEQTLIWDISEPKQPTHVSTIINPAISIHHGARLAPDGKTLVLNDELAGAAFSPGCLGTGSRGLVGALWFYDVSDPAIPRPLGSFSTEERSTSTLCTSHFYNFVPGTTYLVVGWYESGMLVVDYADPSSPRQHAFLRPGGRASFWAAYYWHGHLYGASRTPRFDGLGGGLWVARVDGIGDVAPAPQDEGTSWARWSGSQTPAGQDERSQ